ncbi:MAG: TVP38/TMEM64 family protein [Proteobacteria bacterium]|nr:TVP38/TMEM64 family protein [Pseudomonadota bacterium]MBU1736782.1 TVP38/TMEM64 family protein [Pseudomonadota bacterium]
MKKRYLPLYAALAVLTAFLLCFSYFDICPVLELLFPALQINKTTIVDFIRSLGAWGALGSIGLMIVHSFIPYPAEFLTIANGMVFGPFWGVVITWVGAMLGAYASFGLTRRYGRPFVARKVNRSQLEKIDRWVQDQGAMSLLLSRFIPIISFNLINYGAGMTRISWWTFSWTTGLGILPMTLMMVILGDNVHVLPWWTWVILLVAIIGITFGMNSLYAGHRKKKLSD